MVFQARGVIITCTISTWSQCTAYKTQTVIPNTRTHPEMKHHFYCFPEPNDAKGFFMARGTILVLVFLFTLNVVRASEFSKPE